MIEITVSSTASELEITAARLEVQALQLMNPEEHVELVVLLEPQEEAR